MRGRRERHRGVVGGEVRVAFVPQERGGDRAHGQGVVRVARIDACSRGEREGFGNACAYLASDFAANSTGEALNVSGGQQMH